MLTEKTILELAETKKRLLTSNIASKFHVSRQYASMFLNKLVDSGKLIKFGSTKLSFYVLEKYAKRHQLILISGYKKSFKNVSLEEHKILNEIERKIPVLLRLPENVRSIFTYAFSEMLNNAIEHSHSRLINIEVWIKDNILSFIVNDSGIGVFKSVLKKKHLRSELEAIQDILKGKTTTAPKSHSGEGIFFTSKISDEFILDSYGYKLIFNNKFPDVFLEETKKIKRGTKVIFNISTDTDKHLNDIFRKYTNLSGDDSYGFDKTEIQVKLYAIGGVHISRSQARRVLTGLDKFKIILFDYDKVPVIGQAFADEIYRVFHSKYPGIIIEEKNMNEAVQFMINRAKTEAAKSKVT